VSTIAAGVIDARDLALAFLDGYLGDYYFGEPRDLLLPLDWCQRGPKSASMWVAAMNFGQPWDGVGASRFRFGGNNPPQRNRVRVAVSHQRAEKAPEMLLCGELRLEVR
jgi:hypothetical protein